MNKKAQATEAATITITIVFIILIAIIAMGYARYAYGGQKQAEEKIQDLNEEIILNNYLKSPVQIDINLNQPDKPIKIKEINMAELIILAKDNEYAKQELKKHSEKILTPLFKDPFFWGIHLFDQEEIFAIYQQAYESTIEYDEVETYEQFIPDYNQNIYTVKLIQWED